MSSFDVTLLNDALQYYQTNNTKKSSLFVSQSQTAYFYSCSFTERTGSLPPSSNNKERFQVFIDGQLIAQDHWTIQEVSPNITVTLNTGSLGWNIGPDQVAITEIILRGKFDI